MTLEQAVNLQVGDLIIIKKDEHIGLILENRLFDEGHLGDSYRVLKIRWNASKKIDEVFSWKFPWRSVEKVI